MSFIIDGDSSKPLSSAKGMYVPEFVRVLREGYRAADLRADAIAGLTVAIVALPLSMAIAIAAGARPESGLVTAVVGGFAISALGGSRFQVGGPAGAFIVVMAATLESAGQEGFLLATLLSGLLLALAGWLKLGGYIRYIPYPVTVGFTAGIAVIIFSSQIAALAGLQLAREPGALLPKLEALWGARGSVNPAALAMSFACVALIAGLRAWRPRLPGFLAAVALAALATYLLALPVETIGSRFGALPGGLPRPRLPQADLATLAAVLPAAFTFAMLGAIESLLSAVVADSMSGRRHRPDCELVAQGAANVACAMFGGLCATGTIARTATNVRAGAHGPVAGMLHALFILLFLLAAAPLARQIPLCALAAVLATVCWNMADRGEFAAILRHDRGEAAILLATFGLTLFRGLAEGIVAGVALGALIFMHRMAAATQVDAAEAAPGAGGAEDVVVARIDGPFFFGTAAMAGVVFERLGESPRAFVLDMALVPLADATAAQTLRDLALRLQRKGARVYVANAAAPVRRALGQAALEATGAVFATDVAQALRMEAERALAAPGSRAT